MMMAAEGGATSEDLEMAHALVALATPTAAKRSAKRRRSDVHSLSEKNWRSERSSLETHTQFLLEKRNVEMTSEKVTLRSKKARAAARARWEGFVEDEEGTVFEKDATTGARGPGMAAARRTAIVFFSCTTMARRPSPSGAAAAASSRKSCTAWVCRRDPRPSFARSSRTSSRPKRKTRPTTRVSACRAPAGRPRSLGKWPKPMSCTRQWGRAWGSPRRLPWSTSSARRRTRTAIL